MATQVCITCNYAAEICRKCAIKAKNDEVEASRQEGREEMRRACLDAAETASREGATDIGVVDAIRALSPGGVEAGEGRTVEPEEAAATLAMDDPGMCSHGELNYCHACKHEGVGYTRALADVEREVIGADAPSVSITCGDVLRALARLRGGSRG